MDRLQYMNGMLSGNATAGGIPPKSDDDVVICGAVRTPLCKARRGMLKDSAPEHLLHYAFRGLIERTKVDPKIVQDIIVGNVNQPGAGAITSKMAAFLAGFPDTVPLFTINRFCSSGLEACAIIAAKIKTGMLDCAIGAGVEQMSMFDMQSMMNPELLHESIFEHPQARDCMMGMGQTSENVAKKFGITREEQDHFAYQSHQKAAKAQEMGWFREEIIPVKTQIKKGDKMEDITVDYDDGIRKETTLEGLAKLKPSFGKGGTTTAGNASQLTDGAAAVLLARRSFATKHRLPVIGRFIDYCVVGVPPDIMGIGPAFAIPELLKRNKLHRDDIDIYEVNEAFASQSVYCARKIGINPATLNPKGGAIAFGHPLGCTGARLMATLMPELKR
jgi:acetyl-CoA acyltransferase 1